VKGEDRKFYVVIILVALFGGTLMTHPWPTWHDWLIEKLGEALLIASVLAITVDKYSKTRVAKEVAQDVWKAIIGHPLPTEIQDFLKLLANTHLLRRDWDIRYVFSKNPDPHKINIRVEVKFMLQNLSDTTQPYQQKLQLEKHDNPRVLRKRRTIPPASTTCGVTGKIGPKTREISCSKPRSAATKSKTKSKTCSEAWIWRNEEQSRNNA
jgi:hypothetical protein